MQAPSNASPAFVRFHTAHPRVWRSFVGYALHLIARGHDRYSADGVMHVVRFHARAGDTAKHDGFRINNNHVASYARAFALTYPEHATFFEQRVRRAA